MTWYEWTLGIALAFYVIQSLLFIFGLLIAKYPRRDDYQPRASIIVAARNEEVHLGKCLESLSRLDYPADKIEIIVVDDYSDDATLAIATEYASRHPSMTVMSTRSSDDHLRGKARAIAQGIDRSTGDIVMITDADCIVPPTWIREILCHYGEDTGIVTGLTLLKTNSWFDGIQCLDWAYILAMAAATIAIGKPLSSIGNNFTFRRRAYDDVGGYRGITFSVTEDFALFKAITKSGRWKARFPVLNQTLVMSNPCTTVQELYRQKQRWGVGGKAMEWSAMMIMVFGYLVHAFILFGLFLPVSSMAWLFSVCTKFILDFILLFLLLREVRHTWVLRYFFQFELYFILYVLLLPFIVFLGGKVAWKGRSF